MSNPQNLHITESKDFGQLLDLIHDEYFYLDDVKFDSATKVVEIPYRRIYHDGPRRLIEKRWFKSVKEIDVLRNVLRIRNVESLQVDDRAGIGRADFNEILFDAVQNELTFTCGFPCTLIMKVSALSVENEELGFRGKAHIVTWIWGLLQTTTLSLPSA